MEEEEGMINFLIEVVAEGEFKEEEITIISMDQISNKDQNILEEFNQSGRGRDMNQVTCKRCNRVVHFATDCRIGCSHEYV